jgi:hypothetical protein
VAFLHGVRIVHCERGGCCYGNDLRALNTALPNLMARP